MLTLGSEIIAVQHPGGITTVTLNRPERRNALSLEMIESLHAAMTQAAAGASSVVLLRSSVPAVFCAGFDLAVLRDNPEDAQDPAASLYNLYSYVERLACVTVGFADGRVVGGGVELFLSCDIRLASPAATFNVPAVRLSQVYNAAGVMRYINLLGEPAAKQLLVAGETFDIDDALRAGLVTRTVQDEGEALVYCQKVARGAPLAQVAMKNVFRAAQPTLPVEALAAAKQAADAVHASDDRREALAALGEKRDPEFRGR